MSGKYSLELAVCGRCPSEKQGKYIRINFRKLTFDMTIKNIFLKIGEIVLYAVLFCLFFLLYTSLIKNEVNPDKVITGSIIVSIVINLRRPVYRRLKQKGII